jgi:predicted phosphodiesterase
MTMSRPNDDGSRTADLDRLGEAGPRIALISDIHSNRHALEAVLDAVEGLDRPVDEIVCAGDVVGYNAHPQEVVDTVRDEVHATVLGNHDWAATEGSPDGFNSMGVAGVEHAEDQLTADGRDFVADLPLRAKGMAGGVTLELVHASPDDPVMRYVFPPEGPTVLQAAADERRDEAPYVIAVGHTHVPMGFLDPGPAEDADPKDPKPARHPIEQAEGLETAQGPLVDVTQGDVEAEGPGSDEVGRAEVEGILALEGPAPVALVNPGSVGQPRDGDSRASFAVLDTGAREITWYRVPYDVEAARDAVLQADLPRRIGDRLLSGQ